ncbi:hypothetical protein TWF102_003555 [Orbilia oligospora]|uniref:Uncharacterized protein n=1 Tax=Orbilia oligospora TaxID=2813651 RepID=A0A7C8N283_ORBOL|nr:hypothetical protein TWF102_003555 [Orbilia oligospora]KAF3112971.1 hypothetical protein TWF706_009986 [Orbilia oligospora]KAF3116702.1 hypothetical protein TWF103_008460 [Orbilia oligospora]KAF3118658.1 hypothetical protein TWF703_004631 [Orbilia oligospora]KAF3129282.1 hypothetical protein TWF594_011041 [Orbilia oligospora]
MTNTIPLLPELIFETLGHCNIETIWNFAKASRASYLIAFRVLASEYKFPLTIPHALRSGLVEKHREGGFYDRIDTVAIDVTETSWRPSSLPNLLEFLKSKRENNASANVIIYSHQNEYCSINTLTTVFKEIFVEFYDTIKGLSIRVDIAQVDEGVLVKRINELYTTIRSGITSHKISRGREGHEPLPLKSLDLRIQAYSARSTMDLFLRAVSHVVSVAGGAEGNRLEDIKLVVRWAVYNSVEASAISPLDINLLKSDYVRKVWLEDKNWFGARNRVGEIVRFWPKVEELHLDCGVGGSLVDYEGLRVLKTLRTLSIPFPYAGWLAGEEGFCCMRSLFWTYFSQESRLLQEDGPLRQIQFHYLRRDGLMTNYTKITLRKKRVDSLEDANGRLFSQLGGGAAATAMGILADDSPGRLAFTIEDLGDRPTDPIDLSAICQLMLAASSRIEKFRWTRMHREFLNPFLNGIAESMMAVGDRPEHWSGLEDAVSNPNINRAGIKCTDHNCIA